MHNTPAKYPVGIQPLPEIIEEGYLNVDKTEYVRMLTYNYKCVFLSRPRRFDNRRNPMICANNKIIGHRISLWAS